MGTPPPQIQGAAMTRRQVLTAEQRKEIRAQHQPGKRGFGYGALAKKYGVGESTIRDVITYRSRA